MSISTRYYYYTYADILCQEMCFIFKARSNAVTRSVEIGGKGSIGKI